MDGIAIGRTVHLYAQTMNCFGAAHVYVNTAPSRLCAGMVVQLVSL